MSSHLGRPGLASVYQAMGDHKAALPLYKQALAIQKLVLGESHPRYSQTLNNLATLHSAMGDHEVALPLLEKVLAITKEMLGEKHPDYATALHNLATLHNARKDYKAALPLHRQALAITKEVLGERHPQHNTGLGLLAGLFRAMNNYKAALPLAKQALALEMESLGEGHPDCALKLHNLANLYQEMGRPGTALPLQERALYLARRRLASEASVQSERQQLAAAEALRPLLRIRLSIPDESARFSHDHVLSWKGASFAVQQARRAFVAAQADPATRQVALDLLDATRSLALLSSRNDEGSRKRALEYTRLKEEKEARLAELSEPFRAALKPPSSEQYRASLPRGVVLVDLLAYDGLDPARPAKAQTWARRLAAWVVRADAPTVRVDLGPRPPVEVALASWREALESGRDAGAAPARLREMIWSPLEKHLGGAELVLVSPDGALGRLPFAALPGAKPGTFLLEEVPLAILPIPQVLPRLLQPAKGKPSLLALGAVEFGDGEGAWQALPATGPEADVIGARFRALLKGEAVTLSGAKASKALLREALPRHRFAHLATHGYFAPPSMKSVFGREDKGKPDLLGREGVTGWNPGLLSGIVLAGANKPTDEDDGVLTALEIAEMDLSGVELAVLSACQTGLGKEAAGEGMLGLQRAFAVAGCKSFVGSLWSVDDAATSVLMERFYLHLWQKKLSKLESLRQAQLDVLRNPEWVEQRAAKMRGTAGLRGVGKASDVVVAGKAERRSPPAWWAAWQLSGDWR